MLLELLQRPWRIEKLRARQATFVFGEGDHGGVPAQAMIRTAKVFQADLTLSLIHLVTADKDFETGRCCALLHNLERSIRTPSTFKRRITARSGMVSVPVGHDQIVTLRILRLPCRVITPGERMGFSLAQTSAAPIA